MLAEPPDMNYGPLAEKGRNSAKWSATRSATDSASCVPSMSGATSSYSLPCNALAPSSESTMTPLPGNDVNPEVGLENRRVRHVE